MTRKWFVVVRENGKLWLDGVEKRGTWEGIHRAIDAVVGADNDAEGTLEVSDDRGKVFYAKVSA